MNAVWLVVVGVLIYVLFGNHFATIDGAGVVFSDGN
jgi:hypothetical protein